MADKLYLYPRWIRIWHLINAIACLLLIFTGLSMQYSGMVAVIRFDVAVAVHNVAGIVLTFNYLVYFLGNFISPNRKHYAIKTKGAIRRLRKQIRFYAYGLFKGEPAPYPVSEDFKFNPLQKTIYIVIMYLCVPFTFISGWALLYPQTIIEDVYGINGILLVDLLHIAVGFVISMFMLVHVYFCTIGATKTSSFKAMASGWQEVH